MAEAEDVIVDAARHATAYAQDLLKRRRPVAESAVPGLMELAPRLDLLLTALHGRHWPLRVAQPPAPVTALARLFRRDARPFRRLAVPSTDGQSIWLPRQLEGADAEDAVALYRAMALQAAERARIRDPAAASTLDTPLLRAVYLVLEAAAADAALVATLPGLRPLLLRLREAALSRRPALEAFPPARRGLEQWLRDTLRSPPEAGTDAPATLAGLARAAAARWPADLGSSPLLFDWWTGEWPAREAAPSPADLTPPEPTDDAPGSIRSARLSRRPTIREADEEEDDGPPAPWMVQTAQPHESAEDPMGQQRPADRDTDHAAESHAESVADLQQARLVRTSQQAQEVLLSDDLPVRPAQTSTTPVPAGARGIRYPEWDFQTQTYRDPGTTVWESDAPEGSAAWVERTLEAQRGMLAAIRRRFEMLRARRVPLRRQDEGDELDLEACIEARADLRAGASMSQRLYRTTRMARRDTAVLVLVDVSGSTDAWIAGQRRIIDVEREALLPLSIALDGSGDAHAILAFSGQGPQQVQVRTVKRFDERHSDTVARRIAGLEPEHYTRAGAALRHASRLLQAQPARHRLLLLLSDGKPNDHDAYEGRYGVEDMRQAVLEARHAGQSPFCLTVDRQAAAYLPRVFGPQHHALLQRPERLPIVLLDWMKRLLSQ